MTTDPVAVTPDDAWELLASGNRRSSRVARVRLGVGAAVVFLLVALVITVCITILAPRGSSRAVSAVSAETARGTGGNGDRGAGGDGRARAGPTHAASDSAVLFVHVLGAVSAPGLYELHAGSRVIDAVSAAGGLTPDADQAGVNLARVLSDGEQLVVPKVGEPPPVGGAPAAGGTAPGIPGIRGTSAGAKVNLNTANQAELETLPGVGPTMAGRILAWRAQNGRFTSIDDLMDITGVGDKTFDALKDLVTV